jgi:DNA-binding response OmpR family regulator
VSETSKRILIVDDEEDVVRPIAFRLGVTGFDVLMEPDGELGYQTAVEQHPDLILLDIMMPGIDGITMCAALKHRDDTRDIPIIMLTARTAAAEVEKCLAAKADFFIAKPFDWSELIGKIHGALAGSAEASN